MGRWRSFIVTAAIAAVAVTGGVFFMERVYPAVGAELGDRLGKHETLIRGTSGADVLRGGPGDEVIADSYIPDKEQDRLYGGGGDDMLDAVSDPPFKDVVRCGPGEDEAQVDPKDDVGTDCERVDTIDLSKGLQPPKGTPKYTPAPGERENKEVQVIDLKE